jgi:alanine racemase
MSTFKQKLKEAKQLLSKTYDTTITYAIVCRKTDTYEDAIEIHDTLEDAKCHIKDLNEFTLKEEGWKFRLYILPIVVDADSYEPVTEENMQYYDKNSEWVKNFKEEMQSLYY